MDKVVGTKISAYCPVCCEFCEQTIKVAYGEYISRVSCDYCSSYNIYRAQRMVRIFRSPGYWQELKFLQKMANRFPDKIKESMLKMLKGRSPSEIKDFYNEVKKPVSKHL